MYNGYPNFSTWQVALWLGNDEGNYRRIKELGEQLLACDDYDFKVIIRNEFYYGDEIDFLKVDYQRIRQVVAETI